MNRTLEVLHYIIQGKSNKEIAREMGISPNTVKFYISQLFKKLGAKNRVHIVATHYQQQIVDLRNEINRLESIAAKDSVV